MDNNKKKEFLQKIQRRVFKDVEFDPENPTSSSSQEDKETKSDIKNTQVQYNINGHMTWDSYLGEVEMTIQLTKEYNGEESEVWKTETPILDDEKEWVYWFDRIAFKIYYSICNKDPVKNMRKIYFQPFNTGEGFVIDKYKQQSELNETINKIHLQLKDELKDYFSEYILGEVKPKKQNQYSYNGDIKYLIHGEIGKIVASGSGIVQKSRVNALVFVNILDENFKEPIKLIEDTDADNCVLTVDNIKKDPDGYAVEKLAKKIKEKWNKKVSP